MPAHIYARLCVHVCISICVRMRMYEMGTHCYFLTRCTFLAYDDNGAGASACVFQFCALPFSQLENRHEKECKKLTTAAAAQRGH